MSNDDETQEPPPPGPWAESAACLGEDPDMFLAETDEDAVDYDPELVEQAKAICAVCPVSVPCLQYAMRYFKRTGIWGGTTPAERIQLSIRQRAEARSR